MSAQATIEAFFVALTAGDLSRLLSVVTECDHFVKIGTDAGETVYGVKDASDYYANHVASTRDFTIDTHRLDVEERDAVAWFSTEQTWHVTWQGTRETLEMRITGVLERELYDWKLVQMHASLGSA